MSDRPSERDRESARETAEKALREARTWIKARGALSSSTTMTAWRREQAAVHVLALIDSAIAASPVVERVLGSPPLGPQPASPVVDDARSVASRARARRLEAIRAACVDQDDADAISAAIVALDNFPVVDDAAIEVTRAAKALVDGVTQDRVGIVNARFSVREVDLARLRAALGGHGA